VKTGAPVTLVRVTAFDDVRSDGCAWPDLVIARIAERQATAISHQQLLKLGLGPRSISRAVSRGRLYRVHQGVYSLALARSRPTHADEWAAILACGPRAVISHHSAARLHGLRVVGIDRQSEVELVIVDGDRGRRRSGLLVHRCDVLHPQELVRVHGLPATSVARTVLDLSPVIGGGMLEHLIDQALRRTSRTKLNEMVLRHPGRPGSSRVRALLDPARPSAETWSRAERRLRDLIRRAGLPAPESNVSLDGFVPDMLWREQQVIVEYDSVEVHSGPTALSRDGARHNRITVRGYQVIHVTWHYLSDRPEEVLVWIATALARV
jgi:predicted transcriptional regulator of viral defense system/very-short-patch-repair endonuclease